MVLEQPVGVFAISVREFVREAFVSLRLALCHSIEDRLRESENEVILDAALTQCIVRLLACLLGQWCCHGKSNTKGDQQYEPRHHSRLRE
jgi:hypothetical protein